MKRGGPRERGSSEYTVGPTGPTADREGERLLVGGDHGDHGDHGDPSSSQSSQSIPPIRTTIHTINPIQTIHSPRTIRPAHPVHPVHSAHPVHSVHSPRPIRSPRWVNGSKHSHRSRWSLLVMMARSHRTLVGSCLLIAATAGLVAYWSTPTLLHVVRKQVEAYRHRQFVGHLRRPEWEISETFYADLEALDELIMNGMGGVDGGASKMSKLSTTSAASVPSKTPGKAAGRRKPDADGVDGVDGAHIGDRGDRSDVGPQLRDVGVVVPCGNTRSMLRNLHTVLAALRDGLRSAVPVTVSYYGSREPIDATVRQRFEARFADVSFMDLSAGGAFEYPPHQRGIDNNDTVYFGFKAKVLALYAAPYRHVLLLDSDSVPLVDPARLFASKVYAEHGNVFWPDRWCEPVPLLEELRRKRGHRGDEKENSTPRPFGEFREFREFRQTDSGQVLFDRARYADVLEYLLFLNAHDEYTYGLAYGDKDTFEAAFLLAGRRGEFHQVGTGTGVGVGAAGVPLGFLQEGLVDVGKDKGKKKHPQKNPKNIAFVHRTSEAKKAPPVEIKRVLWHTDCHWNERHWQFFRPMTWGAGGVGWGGGVAWEEFPDDQGGWAVGGEGWQAAAAGWAEWADTST